MKKLIRAIRRYVRLKRAGYHLSVFNDSVWMDCPDGSGGVRLFSLPRMLRKT